MGTKETVSITVNLVSGTSWKTVNEISHNQLTEPSLKELRLLLCFHETQFLFSFIRSIHNFFSSSGLVYSVIRLTV